MKLWKAVLALCAISATLEASDAAGRWKLVANAPDGNTYNVTLVVKEENGRLSGVLDSERGQMPLQNVVYANGELRFDLVLDMGAIPFRLRIDGDRVSGTLTAPDGSTGSVTGQREGGAPAAQAAGKWEIIAVDPDGTQRRATLDLKQDGERLAGAITLESGDSVPISEGKVAGSTVSFKIFAGDGEIAVSGNVSGDSVSGVYTTPAGERGKFSGTRAGAAASLAGKWNVVARDAEGNEIRSTLELKVDGGRLTGVITTESGDSAPLVDGKVEGSAFSFRIYVGDGNIEVKGRAENGRLTGEYTTPNGSRGTYVATRG
ncbi:MAG: hypothetical protein N2036_01305 [Bryobacteraceae bacterium]|nr:hypothetical protein [Bryobacteraceae bacterium]